MNDHTTVQLRCPFFPGVPPLPSSSLPSFFSAARTPFKINCFSAGTGKELSKEPWTRSPPTSFYPSHSRLLVTHVPLTPSNFTCPWTLLLLPISVIWCNIQWTTRSNPRRKRCLDVVKKDTVSMWDVVTWNHALIPSEGKYPFRSLSHRSSDTIQFSVSPSCCLSSSLFSIHFFFLPEGYLFMDTDGWKHKKT